jgi:aminobenzoyl-glutamate transport protein
MAKNGGGMSKKNAKTEETGKKPLSERLLDGIERVGNKVPHPVLMFLYLIIIVVVLSQILAMMGVSVTEEIAVPVIGELEGTYFIDSAEPGMLNQGCCIRKNLMIPTLRSNR